MAGFEIKPVTLTGKHVQLEPMTLEHVEPLAEIGIGHEFWDFMVYGKMENVEDMRGWVADILVRAAKGTDLPFVAVHLASGRVAGATRGGSPRRVRSHPAGRSGSARAGGRVRSG